MLSIVGDMFSREINGTAVAGPVNETYTRADPGEPEKTGEDLHNPVKLSVIESEQAFDELEEEWNQLLERSEAHVFQSFEWQRTWWEYFGDKGRLHILTFRCGEQLVGLAPFFYSERRMPGLYTYRHLQFLAGYIPGRDTTGSFSRYSISDYLDLIVIPGYQEKVVEALVSYLAEQRSFFDQISLDELSEDGVMMQSFVPRLNEVDWPHDKEKKAVCPQIKLPASMDEYLYAVKSSVRYKLRRSRRPVTDDRLYEIRDVQTEQELEIVFNHLVDLHQARWNKQGYPGVFTDKRVGEFLKEVSKAFLRRNWLMMKSAFDHDGNCLAVDLAYAFRQQVYDYQRAFDITSDLARHRPGFALTYFLIEEAIDKGNEVYDLLRGNERYKLRLASSTPRNWKITIYNLSPDKGFKYRLSRLIDGVSGLRFRIKRELLLLRIHIRERGITGFLPAYTGFIKERLKENANE